ncbi:MAG: hypothetical protein H6656_03630 [Ardenticatenaceae bacterium]|nr:hypothetical protein [Ardenticatenaceae bacterium]
MPISHRPPHQSPTRSYLAANHPKHRNHLLGGAEAQLKKQWFDGAAVATLLAHLPENANLLIGNSLPIRHLDQYGRTQSKTLHIFGNRGASGIDGNIATGLGVATATKRPTFIVVGDVTALHDLNSLLLARQTPNATLIVINNNGGGIFRRLPISQHEPPFTDRFLTPHGRTFAHAAAMFELDYFCRKSGGICNCGRNGRIFPCPPPDRTDHRRSQG